MEDAVFLTSGWVWTVVLSAVIGIPLATCGLLYQGAVACGDSRRHAWIMTAIAAGVLGGWIAVCVLLARGGFYRFWTVGTVPWLGLTICAAVAAMLVTSRLRPAERALLVAGRPRLLVAPQILRIAGGIFVIEWGYHRLPALFALPAGLGDIIVGLAALAIVTGRTDRDLLAFHVAGMIDLVMAVTLGALLGMQVLATTPSFEPVMQMPLALIPTTAVPLALTLHITALRARRTALTLPGETAATA
jgi:hypothetical protein